MKAARPSRLPIAACALLAASLGAAVVLEPRELPTPLIGKPAPAFQLPDLDQPGKPRSSAQMLGQVWVLNVWASWCAPCRDEHPLLVSLARDSGVALVGLNHKDDQRDAQEWLRGSGNPYGATAVDRDGRTGVDYGVRGVPQTFVIDRAGVVRHTHIGPLTRQIWTSEILPLIRRLQAPLPAP
jgi:cytochrome c biogenesis protein CcmG/thiol:disulfide interchange protein DsbE